MAKYLLLKRHRGASAPVNDVPMDQWAPEEVMAQVHPSPLPQAPSAPTTRETLANSTETDKPGFSALCPMGQTVAISLIMGHVC
jgi:hypothetical protein